MELRRQLRVRSLILLATALQIVAAVLSVSMLLAPQAAGATTTIPYLVNFQGRLTDNNGNVLTDGSYNIKFRIFDATSGGTNQWEGDRVYGTADHRVSVKNGLFNIQFGDTSQGDPALSPTLFSSGTQLYLEVELPTPATATCASNGCATFTEGAMTPRQPLASSPYAFNSDTLDGLDSTAFGQLSANNSFTGANTFHAASGISITVQAASSTHSLDVKDSGGTTQAYFDANGLLNVGQTIQATASNAVDLGQSGTTFRTGYFGTSVVTPALNATAAGGTITTNSAKLQRTASGTFTIDLNDGSNTTLAVTNSGTGVANLTVDGGVTVGAFAAATSTPVCSNSGQLSTCNSNPSGVTLQQAYAAGASILTSGSDITDTLNSSQKFSVTTAAGATGFTTFALANGTNTTPPAQLVLIDNQDTNEAPAAGLKITSSGGTITNAIDASGSNITNALSVGANTIAGTTGTINYTNYDLSSLGDQTASFTQLDGTGTASPTGNSATSMSLSGTSPTTTLWDVGNYVKVASTSCGGTGVNTCFAKITAKTATALTITPALSWANNTAVTEWHLPEIGGTDLTQTDTSRYGRGYFIAGVATGNGTTYYDEDGITTSLSAFNLLNDANLTSLNIGNAASTVNVPGALQVAGQSVVNSSGQINGAQIQSGTVANGALTNSTIGVTAGTGLSGGSAAIALGGSTSLSVDQTAALSWTGVEQFNKSGGVGVQLNGTAASGGAQLLFGGSTSLNSGSANGTYIGANPSSYSGDFINLAVNGANKFKVDTSGNVTAAGTVNGQTIAAAASFGTSVSAPTINASTTLQLGGASINTGGATPTLSDVDYLDSNQTITGAKILSASTTFSKSGGAGVILSGTAASAGALLQFGSVASLNGGSANGTYLGANPASYSGDFVNLAINNVNKLKVDNSGNLTAAGQVAAVGVNTGTGTLQTGGTDRLDNAGSLENILNLSQTGTYQLQSASDTSTAMQVLTSSGAGSRGVLVVGTSNTQVSADANLIVNSSATLPSLTSVAFTSNSAGTLAGTPGTSYFYRISAIVGSETAASAEQWINTSNFTTLSAPTAPTAVAGGAPGITGNWTYKYTYTTANGETTASPASAATGAISNKKVTVTVANGPTGTTSKKIYRTTTGPGVTGWFLVGTIANNTTTTFTDNTADAGLGTGTPPVGNSATTDLNSVTLTFPAFPSATGYRIYRGTSTHGEDHYQTAGSCSGTCTFTDTGSVGTAASPIEPTAGRVGIGTTTPDYALDVAGNVSASNAYIASGNVGQTQTCSSGATFSGLTITGGIVTSIGSCASLGGGSGATATLQTAYDNSTSPQIALSSGGGPLTVSDTSGGLGTDLFDVQNNAGTTNYLAVSASGISTSGSLTVGTAVNGAGALTVQSGGATALTIDTGGAAAITLGGTNANAINLANQATNAAAVDIANNNTAHTVNIANGTAANTTTIGSTNGGTSTLQAGATQVQVSGSGALVKTSTNSGTAFQIQNSVGQTVLLADTTSTMTNGSTINYLNYSSFEVGTVGALPTGWTNVGTASTVINNAKQHTYNGLYSAQVNIPNTTGTGLQTSSFVSAPPTATTYIVSFYAKETSGASMTADKFLITSTDGTTHTCNPSSSVTLATSTQGFQRIYCQLPATTGAMTALSITVSDTQTRTFYLDAVQLQANSFNGTTITTPTPFDYGAVQIRGVITNPLALQNNGDSTAAFQIQNASGTSNLFVADTLNGRIGIGTATPTQALDVNGTVNATNFTGAWGGSTIAVNEGGTGQTTYAIGDLLYASATGTLSKLSEPGTSGSCLISGTTGVSGPSWGSCSSAAGAATNLNNLVTTSINQSLLPSANNSLDVGSASLVWAHMYTALIDAGTTTTTLGVGTTNATAVNIGNTTANSAVNLNSGGGTGGINIGDNANTQTIDIGGVTNDGTTTVRIATNGTANADTVQIGNSLAGTAVSLDAGNTGKLQIGNSTAAHTIQVGNGGTSAQLVSVGSTSSTSKLTLQGGAITTTNNNSGVIIGNGFSGSSLIPLTLSADSNFSSDESTSNCSATVNQGSMYYNSTSNAIRGCINGAWEDVVSTGALGLQLFGVVPDTGPDPGNWVGTNATIANDGPCKVYFGSAAKTIRWTSCVAYSGGRKVIVAAQTTDLTLTTSASSWTHICLSGANSQPTPSTFGTENADLPTFVANSPILCLADISTGTGQGNITDIYDTRTFTTSTKEIVNNTSLTPGLGMIAVQTTTAGTVNTSAATAGVAFVRGVIVAATSGTQTANAMNTIIATAGPAYVKSTAGSAQGFVETGTGRAGLAITTTTLPTLGYATLGLSLSAFSSTCGTLADTCRGSLAVNLAVR